MISTLLIILAIVFALIVIAGIVLPSKITFERNLSIDAEIKKVYALIEDFNNWQSWSAWNTFNDPSLTHTFSEKTAGKGAVMQWKGKKLGSGRIEIIQCKPYTQLEMQLSFNNSGFRITYHFNLKELSGTTHVQWKATGRMRRIGIAKIIALMLPRWMGRDMQIGLKLLKQVAEAN